MAPNALTDPNFAPDFTAFVSSDPCRVLRLSRHDFVAAADASAAEKYAHAGHSVTVDMDNKDVRIGLGDKSQSDLVIDMDRFDKVKISSTPAAEGGDVKVTCTVEGESAPAGATSAGTTEKAVVIVEPEQQKKPAIAVVRPIVSAPDSAESADDVAAKRELKRKQHQRHRSKLLAAFMKKKSNADDEEGGADEKGKADEKPSAATPTSTSKPSSTATSPVAQPESSTSEATSGRDRSSSVGFLKELSVRQTEKD